MLLYHVSIGRDFSKHTSGYKFFTPRVPESAAPREDRTVSRICFSETIEGALFAIENFNDKLYNSSKDYYYYLTIYTLDTATVDMSKLVSCKEVYNYVDDAMITKEWWYTAPITLPGEVYLIDTFEDDFQHLIHEHQRQDLMKLLEEYDSEQFATIYDDIKDLSVLDIVNKFLYETTYDISYLAEKLNLECVLTIAENSLELSKLI